ncbi:hypothetical protein EJV46_21480 [Roseococcus sp. SYP-B2431]|uniref:PRC-barrel domain-containing protein n=1 Tax=Roseococcus sp. SYP-B2431 TaxID=2496640 RepID=UPI00103F789B|nr:PRC-barrel domain-containing protein [Roseococcus sp. SYP-B2431]TCH96155.1 hypothetical protein EJV46_21480 [Roseococcus sp. SYP-B2431]
MDRHHEPHKPLLWMILVAGLMAAPVFALAQSPSPPGTVPSPSASPAIPDTAPARSPTGVPAAIAPQVGAPSNPPASAAPGAMLTRGAALLSQPRISRLLGSRIYNDRNQAIGEVEEVLLAPPVTPAAPSSLGPVAIVQLGGFLGMGGRLVSVPLGDLRWSAERGRITMPGATQQALRARPAFDYGMLLDP